MGCALVGVANGEILAGNRFDFMRAAGTIHTDFPLGLSRSQWEIRLQIVAEIRRAKFKKKLAAVNLGMSSDKLYSWLVRLKITEEDFPDVTFPGGLIGKQGRPLGRRIKSEPVHVVDDAWTEEG
jgi:hypothetical protein